MTSQENVLKSYCVYHVLNKLLVLEFFWIFITKSVLLIIFSDVFKVKDFVNSDFWILFIKILLIWAQNPLSEETSLH